MTVSTGAASTPYQELAAPPADEVTPGDPGMTRRPEQVSQRC
ncbi:MAG TPA: hypothetical protein VFV73_37860 [Streptosporangiaceae bacterium]|nr:hypothetical protein [Streptosporangiaceae bacterium]